MFQMCGTLYAARLLVTHLLMLSYMLHIQSWFKTYLAIPMLCIINIVSYNAQTTRDLVSSLLQKKLDYSFKIDNVIKMLQSRTVLKVTQLQQLIPPDRRKQVKLGNQS